MNNTMTAKQTYPTKLISTHDLRVHFIRQALYWRKSKLKCIANGDWRLKEWSEGQYAQAINTLDDLRIGII
jgi:hypothetical protein